MNEYFVVDLTPKEYKRIFKRIDKREDGCWIWNGSLDGQGYGMVWYRGRSERIHRVLYSFLVAPIPRGVEARQYAQLDHICRNPNCCNPEHLELVTQQTNVLRGVSIVAEQARKTFCKHGHPLPERKGGSKRRNCPTCDAIRHKKRMEGPKREYWMEKHRQAAKRHYDKHKKGN